MRTEQQVRSQIAEVERYMLPLKRQIASLRRELRERKSERLGTVIRKGQGCRDRDEELKAERKYTDPSSFVRRDGSEVLKGIDWTNRKWELRERSGGQCEYLWEAPPGRCSKDATIPAHVKPRHPKRDDRMSNLNHYCYEHDRLTEKQGWRRTRFRERATA